MVIDQFGALFANIEIDRFRSSLWRSEMECNIAMCIRALRRARRSYIL